jgi:hypothetical protein
MTAATRALAALLLCFVAPACRRNSNPTAEGATPPLPGLRLRRARRRARSASSCGSPVLAGTELRVTLHGTGDAGAPASISIDGDADLDGFAASFHGGVEPVACPADAGAPKR